MRYQSVLRPGLFAQKTFIVTGGGSGIGRCCAHELASLGAKVILIGRNEEKLARTQAEIIEDGGDAVYALADIRDDDRVSALIPQLVSQHGHIHGLINNAGGQYPSGVADISTKGFEAVIRTNLVGGFIMARTLFNHCLKEHGGAIVNVVADFANGIPGMAHTGAARAGMDNLTKSAAYEWACYGVRVNAVAPGWIASSGMDTYGDSMRAIIPKLKDAIPLKRMGSESEISGAICFLLSEAASFITGATINIDGGAPLGHEVLWPLNDAQHNEAYNGFHRATLPKVLQDLE